MFVLRLVLKSRTVKEVLNERCAQVVAVGCRSGVRGEQSLVVWLVDQVRSDARCVNVLDKNTLRICCLILVPDHVYILYSIKIGFPLADLLAVQIHFLMSHIPLLI